MKNEEIEKMKDEVRNIKTCVKIWGDDTIWRRDVIKILNKYKDEP